jgi:hypothetical protein
MLSSGEAGMGTSLNISREGVAFTCGEILPEGKVVEIDLAWPVLARGRYGMMLRAHGVILRSSRAMSAAWIAKQELVVLGVERQSGYR